MDYAALKSIHIAAVATSYALFFVRGVWMIAGSRLLARTWVRVVPHVVDSILLAAAVAMLWSIGLNPLHAPWLSAKLVALVLYIGLGTVAIRHGRTRGGRVGAWIGAQAVFAYMVAVALTKTPVPGLG